MPKIVDRDAYRATILESCFPLFARRGFSALSVREIAAHLGISTGRLYHYFPTKDALFAHMVQHMGLRDVEGAALATEGQTDPGLRLRAWLMFVRAHERRFQDLILLMFDYRRHADHEEGRAFITSVLDFYRTAIQHQLGLRDAPAAEAFLSLVLGMLVQGMMGGGALFSTEAHTRLLESLL